MQENEEVVELDFIDALTMQELAESLAEELWDQPIIHHQEQEQQQVELLDQRQQRTNTNTNMTGFPFHGDMSRGSYAEADEGFLPTAAAIGTGGNDSLFSFTGGGKSEQLMSFSTSREPKQKESNGGGTTAAGTPLTTTMEGSSKGGRPRASSGVHEHVVAERKRREKMNHQFAALASIIPDITKVS